LGRKTSAASLAVTLASDEYNVATATHTRPTITSASSTILASNSARKFAIIINNSAGTVYLKLGVAAVTGEGITLTTSGSTSIFELNNDKLYTGLITGIKTGGGSFNLDVIEGT
jgi:hypothetical protein